MPDTPDTPAAFMQHSFATLTQIGNIAQANFVTTAKFADLQYLAGNGQVSLEESLGAREVASNAAMGGKPPGT